MIHATDVDIGESNNSTVGLLIEILVFIISKELTKYWNPLFVLVFFFFTNQI